MVDFQERVRTEQLSEAEARLVTFKRENRRRVDEMTQLHDNDISTAHGKLAALEGG